MVDGSPPFSAGPASQVSITASDCTVPAAFLPAINSAAGEAMAWTTNFNDDTSLDIFDQPNFNALGVNWISPQYQSNVDWNTILTGFATNAQPCEQPRDGIILAAESRHENSLGQRQQQTRQEQYDALEQTRSPAVTVSDASSKSAENAYYVDGDGARAPFGGRICERGSILGNGQLLEPLPDDPMSPASPLKTMGRSLCSQAVYDNLVHHISFERQHCEFGPNRAPFPSIAHVQLYIRYYFDYFHPIFPFLRKSALSHIAPKEWLLLLAVAAVGSRYVHCDQDPESRAMLIIILNEALRRRKYGYETERAESNDDLFLPGEFATPPTLPDLTILQAGILNILLLQHSGRKSLVERAILERHYLVEACHSMKLISNGSVTEHTLGAANFASQGSVRDWLYQESKIRTGMMIWVAFQ
jgi:hypothetical protein